jgi:DNA-binding response OmpR family regulator
MSSPVTDRLLLVEDDPKIGSGVCRALANGGYDTEWVTTGEAALEVVRTMPPAMVLLDLGLPDIDGIEVCGLLRAALPTATIIMLTARADTIDVIVGLDAGADDYVTKPFQTSELLARVRAHLRRPSLTPHADVLIVGALRVDTAAHRVHCYGREVSLRPKEFELLVLLAANAGRALTREEIMERVWDEHWFGSSKTLDVHISSLRRKLDGNTCPITITTLRGVGYRLEHEPA